MSRHLVTLCKVLQILGHSYAAIEQGPSKVEQDASNVFGLNVGDNEQGKDVEMALPQS